MPTAKSQSSYFVSQEFDRKAGVVLAAVVVACLWALFLLGWWPFNGGRHNWFFATDGFNGWKVALSLVVIVLLAGGTWGAVIYSGAVLRHPTFGVIALLATLGLILLLFSDLDYVFGTTADFCVPSRHAGSCLPLSRLDAAYVATGTFTTAGYSPITVVSETGRRLLTAEMITELVTVIVFGGLYLTVLAKHIVDFMTGEEVGPRTS